MRFEKGKKRGSAAKDWTADGLQAEINSLGLSDYEAIMTFMLTLPVDKVKYIATQATKIPLIFRLLAASLLSDLKFSSSKTLETFLPYLARKKPVQEEVLNVNTQPQLTIQVSSEAVQNKLNNLLRIDADNEDV